MGCGQLVGSVVGRRGTSQGHFRCATQVLRRPGGAVPASARKGESSARVDRYCIDCQSSDRHLHGIRRTRCADDHQNGMADAVIRQHADDGTSHCRLCTTGAQAGRNTWPCQTYPAARRAVVTAGDAVVLKAGQRQSS